MKFLKVFFLVSLLNYCAGQNYSLLNSVMAWAETDPTKPSLTIKWQTAPEDSIYKIDRKARDVKSWSGKAMATINNPKSSFADTTVEVGKGYEYRITRITKARLYSYTYLYGGVKVNQVDLKKTILLLVDDRVRTGINMELNQLKGDLSNETWNVVELTIPSTRSAVQVKDTIREVYKQYPGLSTIFIMGHVAVPYSGNTNWDGHPDHQGAWVCDNYYADIDGQWTDEFVSNLTPGRNENKNDIGDDKWDDDIIPSDVEFEVGRVDFYNMPALGKTEVELLKKYLNKDHAFRIGKIRPQRRAIVQDNFNFQGEFFGASGYKNYTVFFGPDSVKTENFRDRLLQQSYLCAYGAGGGWYQGAGGISTTADMAKDSLQTVFSFLFGSYFGDWDVQDNFLRSSLASGTILTCAWAGRPGWQIHHMAMGETIGFSTRATINDNLYTGSPYGNRGAHVSLLGDPSLVLLPVIPPSGLNVVENGAQINLSWTASSEATEGYLILRRKLSETTFTKIAENIKVTSFTDKCLEKDVTYEYLVSAIKLETNASGSYYNRSAGVRASIKIANQSRTVASIESQKDYEFVSLNSKSLNSKSNSWLILGKTYNGDTVHVVLPCNPPTSKVLLISSGDCNVDSVSSDITVNCSVPKVFHYVASPEIKCFGDVTNITLDSIEGAKPFTYLWSNGSTDNSAKNVKGKVNVLIESAKGTKEVFEINLPEFPQLLITSIQVKNVNPGFNKGSVTNINAQGGVPPYKIVVLKVGRLDSLDAGNYTLEVTDANGCTSTKSFEIKTNTAVHNVDKTEVTIYPNPCHDELVVNADKIIAYSIVNLDGKTIMQSKTRTESNQHLKINTQELLSGAYQLILESLEGKYRVLFVKE